MDIEKLLVANPAMTDIHLTEGLPLMIRVYGALKKTVSYTHLTLPTKRIV